MYKKGLAYAIIILFVGAGAVSAFNANFVDDYNTISRGNWLYVGGSGPGNYSKIQDAIDNTSNGDTVFVYSGIYYENVEIYKSINLIGESRYYVIVDGGYGEQVLHVTSDYVNISEFSIIHGNHGIHIEDSSNININYCIAYENTYGITPRNSPFTTITNCEAYDNEHTGIIVLSSPNSNFNNNILFNTQSGVYITNSPNCIIIDCEAYNITMEALSSGGSGFYLENSPNCIIENCNSYNCSDYGIYLSYSSECNITNCNFYNNTWNPNAQFPSWYHSVGIRITGSTDCNVMNCSIYNNDNGIYFEEGVSKCILRDNIFYNNVEGSFDITAWIPDDFYLDIDTSNTIDGKPIVYLVGESNLYFDETDDIGYLGLVSCSNISVMNIDISGILLVDTSISTLSSVHSHDCKKGIYCYYSPNCNIMNSEGYNNRFGIYGSSENLINCKFYNNEYGIYLEREYEYENSKGAVNGGNVSKCKSYQNEFGFFEQKGSHITDCEIYNNTEYGFIISCEAEEPESGSVLRKNNFHDNSYNFFAEGYEPSGYAFQDIDDSNMVNGKPIFYIAGEQGQVIDGETTDIGLVVLISCVDMIVQNISTSYNKHGLLLVGTTDSTITNCDFYNNKDGIWLYVNSINNKITNCRCFNNERGIASQEEASFNEINNCHLFNNSQFGYWSQVTTNNRIIGCTINDNGYAYSEEEADYPYSLQYGGPGVMIHYLTPNNLVENCTIYNNYEGIYVFEKSETQTFRNCEVYNNTLNGICIRKERYCLVENCTTYENKYGISLEESSNNEITKCDSYNNDYGIYITASSNNNMIYHNNLINNTQNANDECTNNWDNGYSDPFNMFTDGGNYWSDYIGEDNSHGPNQDIPGPDGIGDISYYVPGDSNMDNYPFIKPDGWENVDQIPNVEIINPMKGYFHFSGIPLFPTFLDIFSDTASIGGFRIRPIIINVTDDIDESADIVVKIFLNGEEKGNVTYYPDSGVFKWKWTGLALGTYNLTVTAMDSSNNIGSAQLDVWNICFIP